MHSDELRQATVRSGMWISLVWQTLVATVVPIAVASSASAASCSSDGPRGGILYMDRCDEFEGRGIFSRKWQVRLDTAAITTAVGLAVAEGTNTRMGRTAWKSVDAMLTTAVTTEALKNLVQRPRPSQSDDPDKWRQGSHNKSFPSGETAMMTTLVTPWIMEYHSDEPMTWGLLALPLYMGRARMASQAHWLSDVVAGAAIGGLSGYLAGKRDSPLILKWNPGGGFVGLRFRF